MRFPSNSISALVCFMAFAAGVYSHVISNELLKVKLHIAGHTLGAAGATGFAGGLLAGAAYLHHKKHHTKSGGGEIVSSKKHAILEHKKEKKDKDDLKWHVHSHESVHSHVPVVSVHQEDHHVVHHDDFDLDHDHISDDISVGHEGSLW